MSRISGLSFESPLVFLTSPSALLSCQFSVNGPKPVLFPQKNDLPPPPSPFRARHSLLIGITVHVANICLGCALYTFNNNKGVVHLCFLNLVSINQTEHGVAKDKVLKHSCFKVLFHWPEYFADLTWEKGLLIRSFEIWICLRVASWIPTPRPPRRVTSGRTLSVFGTLPPELTMLMTALVRSEVTMLMTVLVRSEVTMLMTALVRSEVTMLMTALVRSEVTMLMTVLVRPEVTMLMTRVRVSRGDDAYDGL